MKSKNDMEENKKKSSFESQKPSKMEFKIKKTINKYDQKKPRKESQVKLLKIMSTLYM